MPPAPKRQSARSAVNAAKGNPGVVESGERAWQRRDVFLSLQFSFADPPLREGSEKLGPKGSCPRWAVRAVQSPAPPLPLRILHRRKEWVQRDI